MSDYPYTTPEQVKLIYVANNQQFSNDEKMTLLSDKYRRTSDQLINNDLIKSDCLRLLQQADEYKVVRYIKYVVSDIASRLESIPADAVYLN